MRKLRSQVILILAFLVLFFSCEVPFDDNARLRIKGQIFDQNNEPLSGADILVSARESEGFLFGTVSEVLGESESISDGTFEIITLLGRDRMFIVEVFVDNNHSSYQYITDTEVFTPTNYTIDLGTVPINRIAQFNFNIIKTSVLDAQFQYTLEYKTTPCQEIYDAEQINEEESFCYEPDSFGRTLSVDNPNEIGNFITLLDSEVLFTFSINGQPEVSQTIIIDQIDYEFIFNY